MNPPPGSKLSSESGKLSSLGAIQDPTRNSHGNPRFVAGERESVQIGGGADIGFSAECDGIVAMETCDYR